MHVFVSPYYKEKQKNEQTENLGYWILLGRGKGAWWGASSTPTKLDLLSGVKGS